jgi:predicted ester cyclase
MEETYREVVERVWHERDLRAIDEHFTEDYQAHDPAVPRHKGRAGMKLSVTQILEAFADVRYEVLRFIAEGDYLATHWIFSGVHRAEFLGLAASGARITAHGMSISRFVDGRIAEGWIIWDAGAARLQMAAPPSP